jgi:thioredoxin reductase/pSer/pThr/pTyr-binding forkhead associated (FHA) protein/ferredoxin
MAGAHFETRPDGSVVLNTPVQLPEVLDALIVGGGPFGTAAAFRLKELGRSALVVDYDDLMKRIRDYAKDKLILPDYGGGDRMQFPKGGPLVQRLQFAPIDKDAMCVEWKSLYREFSIPAQVGVEMTGLERDHDVWKVLCWNHNLKAEQQIRARHVVLAFGRGVPRRFDIPGNTDGLAFSLSTADKYVGEPAVVIGGGTSAAEAVIAISGAKMAAGDQSDVYWSYRGEKMPKVSRALADPFFDAFVGNGNVRYLPNSEPVAVLEVGESSFLSVRTNRVVANGCPPETTQLEFRKTFCIACIGEDIPEAMLAKIGTPLVAGGPANKKRIVVSPLLETRQPNVYLAGDVLSPAYFETQEFDDPTTFKEVKRRGNIKAAMRDGVLIAQVIDQKLQGRTVIEVHLEFEDHPVEGQAAAPAQAPAAQPPAEAPASTAPRPATQPRPPAPPPAAAAARCRLVSILPSGIEANEFALSPAGPTTIGRQGADVTFPEDLTLSDIHARIIGAPDGYTVRDEGSAEGVFLQPARNRLVNLEPGAIIRAGRQWLVIGEDKSRPTLLHYDSNGRRIGRHDLKQGSTMVGRQSPDITIAPDDGSLSRRHCAFVVQDGAIGVKDLGSGNGTYVKVAGAMKLVHGDRLHMGRQVLQFTDEQKISEPKSDITVDTSFYTKRPTAPVAAQPPAAPAPAPAAAQAPPAAPTRPPAPTPARPAPAPARPAAAAPAPAPAPAAARPAAAAPAPAPAAAGQPSVMFQAMGKLVPCGKGQTICEAAEHAGIKMDADCHQGVCGMDPVKVISGGEFLTAMASAEKGTLEDLCSLEPGPYRLACMARVSGPVVVDIIKQ